MYQIKKKLLQGVIRSQWHFSVFGAVILTRMPSGHRYKGVGSDPTSAPFSRKVRHELRHFESIRPAIECKCAVSWIFILTSCSM